MSEVTQPGRLARMVVLRRALGAGVVGVIKGSLGSGIPMAPVDALTWAKGIALMTGIGVVIGVLPAWRGMRLRIVDALAGR